MVFGRVWAAGGSASGARSLQPGLPISIVREYTLNYCRIPNYFPEH